MIPDKINECHVMRSAHAALKMYPLGMHFQKQLGNNAFLACTFIEFHVYTRMRENLIRSPRRCKIWLNMQAKLKNFLEHFRC